MGSGQLVADPLLGFIRKIFWGDTPPNLQDGIFAVTMVLKLGCDMAPTGVAAPIQMATLERDKKGRYFARRITEDEQREHEENVDGAIDYFRGYPKSLSGTDIATQELPTLPLSPSKKKK